MKQLQSLMHDILLHGQERSTRSGVVTSVFRREFSHDMRTGFPATTGKKLMFRAMVGEGLWFSNGDTDLVSLRKYSSLPEDAYTIWTKDCNRWNSTRRREGGDPGDLGLLYGKQWRAFGENLHAGIVGVDQLQNLIDGMISNPNSRYHIVQAYNPLDVDHEAMALPPCHTGFQVYVDKVTGEFDLDWTQRSVDIFLGAPFNIASYGWLMCVLGQITGLTPRFLYGSLKDTHLYKAHESAVLEYLSRDIESQNITLVMPKITCLDDLKGLTAKDFSLENYNPQSPISAPLSVGV